MNEPFIYVPPKASHGKTQHLALVENICLTLFDRWCERRNVVALAYLLHRWPLVDDSPIWSDGYCRHFMNLTTTIRKHC